MRQVLLFLITCVSLISFAQNSAYNPVESKGKLYEYAKFTKTPIADIQEILSNESRLEFQPLSNENQSVGFTSADYWVKFSLENTSSNKETYYLETARPITDVAHLYQINDGNIIQFNSGDGIAFSERQVQHRETIFKVTLPKNSMQQFYLYLKSDGETLNLPLKLYTEEGFWKSNYNQQLFLGVFYGLLFLATLIYLFFYTSLSNKTFLYYGVYVFSIALLQMALDGLIFQYLLPSGGYLNDHAVLITALFSNFFLLKYCEHFLKVKKRSRILKQAFKVVYSIIIVLGVMIFINDKTKALVYPIINLNGLLSLILIVVTLFYLRYKRIAIDPFFSIGIFFLVLGLLGFVMNNLSLLPNSFLVLNSAKFGIGFEVVFLSLSMTNLIRDLRLENEDSQRIALTKSEEISELKSYFMSNISHELRTPINAIMGIADDELFKNTDTETHKNFEIIKHASLSLLSNINNILDFEKIEKGSLKLRMECFNPKQAIEHISNNWQRMAEKKGLKYSLILENALPYSVEGDPERFTQIINNVLSNAVKFTTFGSIEFHIKSRVNTPGLVSIEMTVLDTGVGINSHKKANLFNSFGQMGANDKRRFGGVGLGLSIVKHLIDLFGGKISIDSEEARGTQVTLSVALKVIELVMPDSVVRTKEDVNDTPLRVLVVEDNVMNQLIMKKILNTLSITDFKMAFNGKEALELIDNNAFDIILMDLQMPVMDGYETTISIRNGNLKHRDKDIPIIAVTADTTETAREKVLAVGMNDYITKPVNRVLLFEKINKHKKNTLNSA
ncbi:hybrid sensor histidine kinase/response regulator [Lacinutrix sp. Hel_I_90]|uniref:hybrid sensor histidine kinase/response regulator n=1 Tax=Lacinutrix sp. Hel_I_90 TaxID=1249999 RepID=UPI0005C9ED65|nr:hybrid sensor histidine kinase/response regulator [Lacinutrix sp. Hel_I_90]